MALTFSFTASRSQRRLVYGHETVNVYGGSRNQRSTGRLRAGGNTCEQ